MPFVTEDDKKSYLLFMKGLLKDKPYVSLAYMTGILPIAKYSSGSELNMFIEYTMASETKFGEDFGFSEEEVDMLYGRYEKKCDEQGKRNLFHEKAFESGMMGTILKQERGCIIRVQ